MSGQENAKSAGRCVIFGGADIGNYEYIKSRLKSEDFLIFCDSGLKHMQALDLKPDLIVGDFDSHENPHLDVETIVLPCEKDDTDTVFAVKEAVKRGFLEFLLLGVVGARLDHTLGNVYILEYLSGLGKRAVIIDDYSEMRLVTPGHPASIGGDSEFFSLINISGLAKGITITGAKYTLHDAEIKSEYQYGVSNEVLPGETAEVSVDEGSLLLIKVRRQ
ncbi:thiamine diphosphokinase [Butyrivibrio sp. FCS014]|uniref:thiamine diphosphokinase n=1 Tax=Butyrivibrio sp. FCS014 TaxID=1408304 RepID=UPI00046524C4|nr:thiamine diphosphokinase [Butyrivibrio sp. FCS014]